MHVLIMEPAPALSFEEAAALWERLAGRAEIGPYDDDRRGIEYFVKTMETSDDYDFDADLPIVGRHTSPPLAR
jgi:hypothetical protein